MNIDVANGIFILFGLVGLSVVNELVKLIFQRLRTSDYVTKSDCTNKQGICVAGREKEERDLKGEVETLSRKVDSLTKLMVQMAIKIGIESKDIEKIV